MVPEVRLFMEHCSECKCAVVDRWVSVGKCDIQSSCRSLQSLQAEYVQLPELVTVLLCGQRGGDCLLG